MPWIFKSNTGILKRILETNSKQGLKVKVLSKMIFKKRSNAPRVQGPAGQNIDFRIF